ncbi:hypothetical protein O2K51_04020 [Apibacter raozihei]|uniref:hypothetical protein n=1 Tax=Apibacter raozihei TaxID=2500547 RepID=UPI000FE3CFBE|nr:hypothetical protein [Apibacter raozihei]
MKTRLLFFLILFTVNIYAQHKDNPEVIGSTLASDSFVLKGDLTIYFKDGTSQTGKYHIKGTEIKEDHINYKDIDYIKTDYGRYEYVNVSDNKVFLLKVEDTGGGEEYLKSEKLTFYVARAKLKGSVNQMGSLTNVQPYSGYYMVKEGIDKAVYFKYMSDNFAKKYFSDCKGIMEIYNDKKRRKKFEINSLSIFRIYNNDCKEGYTSDYY